MDYEKRKVRECEPPVFQLISLAHFGCKNRDGEAGNGDPKEDWNDAIRGAERRGNRSRPGRDCEDPIPGKASYCPSYKIMPPLARSAAMPLARLCGATGHRIMIDLKIWRLVFYGDALRKRDRDSACKFLVIE